MDKILLIGWKDLRLAFLDRAALILMLAAPFLLTLGLGLVTGRLTGGTNSAISSIPVLIVNQDGGQLGSGLVDVFQSPDLNDLLDPSLSNDAAAARAAVDSDQTAAAVIIPPGFSDSILAAQPTGVAKIEIYANPERPTGSGVVRAIVEGFLNQVKLGRVSGVVAITQLIENSLIQPQDAARLGTEIGERAAQNSDQPPPITLRGRTDENLSPPFDALAYMAPGMALLFLMYTVANGGRTILSEQTEGTLPRLLVAPVSMAQALAGKALGIYLTGVAQMLILIGGSALLFGINWGGWPAVILLVLAAVFGALGWGLLLTALANSPGQVGWMGSAMMLIFGILGGSFWDPRSQPQWLRNAGRITPNAWALDGFSELAVGGGLDAVTIPILGLLAMGLILFAVTVVIFLRRGGLRR